MIFRTFMTLASVSAIALAAPAMAQSPNGDRAGSHQLQMQLDAGIGSGSISRREAVPLRQQLGQLTRLERQYSRAGINSWERKDLQARSRTLRIDIRAAERAGSGRFGAGRDAGDDRFDRAGRGDRFDDRFDNGDRGDRYGWDDPARWTNRGDRFNGDLRIGQQASARFGALPATYRDRYRDSEQFYYRAGAGRIYKIDRRSNLILLMMDISG